MEPQNPINTWARGVGALVLGMLAAAGADVQAQDIEPRAYSNAPIGVNFVIAGYAHTRGGFVFDPALPAKDPQLETSNALLAYARVLDFWGSSGTPSAIVSHAAAPACPGWSAPGDAARSGAGRRPALPGLLADGLHARVPRW